jgi:sugar diacid utilization regulator
VHCYDDYVLHDVLDLASSQGDRLIAQTLGPLLELGEGGERLIHTLDAYFRSGFNHKVTAAAVDIHRNTLTHRLEQIRRVTGLDLENPAERLRMETALRFLEFRRWRRDRV